MWKDVWICEDEHGHLQATGFDDKGRKQYLYHPDWVKYRQQHKFDRLKDFGKGLLKIRHAVEKDLEREGWDKRKALALTVKMLDEHYLRVGRKEYTKSNQSYGLTTLRRKHINKSGKSLELVYQAKSGKERRVMIRDKELKKLIESASELPGYEIFKYLDENGKSQSLLSEDINEYIQQLSGHNFTAKDFRTWGGTVLTVEKITEARQLAEENPRLALDATVVKLVAQELGNTPATCRTYYIHPGVLDFVLSKPLPSKRPSKWWTKEEKIVLEILET
jgi:DNA topoisomerase-1